MAIVFDGHNDTLTAEDHAALDEIAGCSEHATSRSSNRPNTCGRIASRS